MTLLVDSDGGVYDAALLWLATQDVELVAVTAVGGNVPVRQAARDLRLDVVLVPGDGPEAVLAIAAKRFACSPSRG